MRDRADDPDAMWKPGYVPPPGPEVVGDDVRDGANGAVSAWQQPAPAVDEPPVSPPAVDEPLVALPADEVDPAAERARFTDEGLGDGEELTIHVTSPAPRAGPAIHDRSRRRHSLRLAGVAAALVAIAAVGVAVLVSDEAATARAQLPSVPASIDVTWTVPVAGPHPRVAAAGDVVVVVSADRAARVSALDVTTGEERWTVRTGRADSLGELVVVDDVVVVSSVGRSPMIRAIDASDGEVVWDRRVHAGDAIAAFGDTVAVIGSDDDSKPVTALDASTGEPTGTLEDPTARVGQVIVRVDGRSVEAFDEALRRLAGPIEVGDAPALVAVAGDVVVTAGSRRLRATEFDGRERWSMAIAPDAVRYLLPSAGAPGEVLLLSASSITSVDTRGASPVVRWEIGGTPMVDPSGAGTRYLPVSVAAGSPLIRIVDLRTGEETATIDLGDPVASPLVGSDGLVLTRQLDEDSWLAEGRRLDTGAATWTAEVPGRPMLVDGGLVAVHDIDGTTALTYAGRG